MSPGELRRFEEKYIPEPNSGCWLWTACTLPTGYGQLGVRRGRKRSMLAHRLSYEHFHNDKLQEEDLVLHHCDTPQCVNPDHLFVGTQADNMADMDRKGRRVPPPHRAGERNGHARLKRQDVRAIRAAVAAGESHRQLAERYGVSRPTVSAIAARRIWKHIEQEG